MSMKKAINFIYQTSYSYQFRCYKTKKELNCQRRSWNCGPQQLGQFRMQETKHTLRKFRHNLKSFWIYVALTLLVTYQMLSATQANMIMVQKGLHCFVGLEGSLVCFFFIICMANELAWAVCPSLYLCTWFFTSEKKSFYLVS